jgi:hypothetical protein
VSHLYISIDDSKTYLLFLTHPRAFIFSATQSCLIFSFFLLIYNSARQGATWDISPPPRRRHAPFLHDGVCLSDGGWSALSNSVWPPSTMLLPRRCPAQQWFHHHEQMGNNDDDSTTTTGGQRWRWPGAASRPQGAVMASLLLAWWRRQPPSFRCSDGNDRSSGPGSRFDGPRSRLMFFIFKN